MKAVTERRIRRLREHLGGRDSDDAAASAVVSAPVSPHPTAAGAQDGAARRDSSKDYLKLRGWGHVDTEFFVNGDGQVELSGTRYSDAFPGASRTFPKVRAWMEDRLGLDIERTSFMRDAPPRLSSPVANPDFLAAVRAAVGPSLEMYTDDECRLRHAHGATVGEVWELRYGESIARAPDLVVYPHSHADVEALVKAAVDHDAVIIPFGGGTTVSGAVECPPGETRCIVSLDTSRMNRIRWVNRENMTACIEAGAIGTDIEAKLESFGLTMGHEPDSYEFSTMGGWVATRASGMKKNIYGNIEDILINFKVVTPRGTMECGGNFPRVSAGPDLMQVIMGSEGTLGVVTEAIVRLQPAPLIKVYGSVIFPDFESGIQAMREVARQRCQPASIRLVDNDQFRLGQVLKTESATPVRDSYMSAIQQTYVLKIRGFDEYKMCACTLLFQGADRSRVRAQERQVYSICRRFGGMAADAKNGIRGYFLTYMIAYLRDVAMNYHFIAESFETSVPWDKVQNLCVAVKARIYREATAHGIVGEPLVSCRVTQTYDVGACVYVYFGFNFHGLEDPVRAFTEMENAARDTIIESGGSISHHHGIGKHRKKWLAQHHGSTGMALLHGIKTMVDPKNTFAAGNLL